MTDYPAREAGAVQLGNVAVDSPRDGIVRHDAAAGCRHRAWRLHRQGMDGISGRRRPHADCVSDRTNDGNQLDFVDMPLILFPEIQFPIGV